MSNIQIETGARTKLRAECEPGDGFVFNTGWYAGDITDLDAEVMARPDDVILGEDEYSPTIVRAAQ